MPKSRQRDHPDPLQTPDSSAQSDKRAGQGSASGGESGVANDLFLLEAELEAEVEGELDHLGVLVANPTWEQRYVPGCLTKRLAWHRALSLIIAP